MYVLRKPSPLTSEMKGRLSLLMSPARTTWNHSFIRKRKSASRSFRFAPSAYDCATIATIAIPTISASG